MTTKFSTRQPIQKTPWPCKRSPPCMDPPPPIEETLWLCITVIWKQPPFNGDDYDGWYHEARFNIPRMIPYPMWFEGESPDTDVGHVRTSLRYYVNPDRWRFGHQFHPNFAPTPHRGTTIWIDLPPTPFCAGPFETTDYLGVAEIIASIMAPA